MLRLLSDLIRRPIVSERDGSALAQITGVVFEAAKGKVLAYRLDRDRFVSTVDIRGYTDQAVLVGSEEAIQTLEELPSARKAAERGIQPLGVRAVTTKGKRLGMVRDAAIETEGNFLMKLHVKPPPWRLAARELIIPRDRVVRYGLKQVVVRYDMNRRTAGLEPETAS